VLALLGLVVTVYVVGLLVIAYEASSTVSSFTDSLTTEATQ
jgi:hypothetical protein